MNNIHNKLIWTSIFLLKKRILCAYACAISPILLLGCANSTSPLLDKRFGSALFDAKKAQSLEPSVIESAEAIATGRGMPSATESLRGLEVHNKGRTTPPALTAK